MTALSPRVCDDKDGVWTEKCRRTDLKDGGHSPPRRPAARFETRLGCYFQSGGEADRSGDDCRWKRARGHSPRRAGVWRSPRGDTGQCQRRREAEGVSRSRDSCPPVRVGTRGEPPGGLRAGRFGQLQQTLAGGASPGAQHLARGQFRSGGPLSPRAGARSRGRAGSGLSMTGLARHSPAGEPAFPVSGNSPALRGPGRSGR